MNFVEKLQSSLVNGAGVSRFFYHAAGEINTMLADAEIGDEVVALCYLLGGGEVEIGRQCRESVQLAVFFCQKTEFDFNSFENEQKIDECKRVAFGWLSSLMRSPWFTIDGDVSTQRVYDTTTDILTGIAVNIALKEIEGYGLCDMPEKVLKLTANGVYDVAGYDYIHAEITEPQTAFFEKERGALYVVENGVYKIQAREPATRVIVSVEN